MGNEERTGGERHREEDGCLGQGNHNVLEQVALGAGRERGEKDEEEHRRDVLDDQPADGYPAVDRIHQSALFERTDEDDGAGDRSRESEDERLSPGKAERGADP